MFLPDDATIGPYMTEHINLGKWTESDINLMLSTANYLDAVGERIQYISGKFLETPYRELTLIGNAAAEEEFVVDLSGIDCFTFLDYVEALRRSSSFTDFLVKLKKVRYRAGTISFATRNHFFTDWREFSGGAIADITREIGADKTRRSLKNLNLRSDGSRFLDGLPVVERMIEYIPASSIDDEILQALETGDYIGIYTETDGLDVSHVGIAITHDDGIYLRHASSAESCRRVTDRLFVNYIKEKSGVVVFRPRSFQFEIFHGAV
jgi:hypothetical protein